MIAERIGCQTTSLWITSLERLLISPKYLWMVRGIFMRICILLLVLSLAACGGGEAGRWINAENKIVSVEDIPYQVSWVRDSSSVKKPELPEVAG